jgi:hypothetical protein
MELTMFAKLLAINLETSDGNLIVDDYIGTDVFGTYALNGGNGVTVGGSNNTIGGTTAVDRNVISGNAFNACFFTTAPRAT